MSPYKYGHASECDCVTVNVGGEGGGGCKRIKHTSMTASLYQNMTA